jgi:hypothetical protein
MLIPLKGKIDEASSAEANPQRLCCFFRLGNNHSLLNPRSPNEKSSKRLDNSARRSTFLAAHLKEARNRSRSVGGCSGNSFTGATTGVKGINPLESVSA